MSLILPVRQPPRYKLRRDTRVEGTVAALDIIPECPGVKVEFDEPVNRANYCYATYDELTPV